MHFKLIEITSIRFCCIKATNESLRPRKRLQHPFNLVETVETVCHSLETVLKLVESMLNEFKTMFIRDRFQMVPTASLFR